MTRQFLLCLVAAFAVIPSSFAQYTTTIVAGGGPADGVSALSVALADVEGIAADSPGTY